MHTTSEDERKRCVQAGEGRRHRSCELRVHCVGYTVWGDSSQSTCGYSSTGGGTRGSGAWLQARYSPHSSGRRRQRRLSLKPAFDRRRRDRGQRNRSAGPRLTDGGSSATGRRGWARGFGLDGLRGRRHLRRVWWDPEGSRCKRLSQSLVSTHFQVLRNAGAADEPLVAPKNIRLGNEARGLRFRSRHRSVDRFVALEEKDPPMYYCSTPGRQASGAPASHRPAGAGTRGEAVPHRSRGST